MSKQFYNNIIPIQPVRLNYERERVKNAHSALIYQISKHYFNGAFCILNKY